MKKATIFAALAIAIAVSSCGNTATENKTATSTDSISVVKDSTKVDSTATTSKTVDTPTTK